MDNDLNVNLNSQEKSQLIRLKIPAVSLSHLQHDLTSAMIHVCQKNMSISPQDISKSEYLLKLYLESVRKSLLDLNSKVTSNTG
ncbi:hypothetical protein pb186bvf_003859 [Paramecium bursaria]